MSKTASKKTNQKSTIKKCLICGREITKKGARKYCTDKCADIANLQGMRKWHDAHKDDVPKAKAPENPYVVLPEAPVTEGKSVQTELCFALSTPIPITREIDRNRVLANNIIDLQGKVRQAFLEVKVIAGTLGKINVEKVKEQLDEIIKKIDEMNATIKAFLDK